MESISQAANGQQHTGATKMGSERCGYFKMPVHYPRYTRADYEAMPEWKLDVLLKEYGLSVDGGVEHKRKFAMGAFLWPL